MAVDAQAAQELQAYESPKSPEEKEPPDQRPKAPLQSREKKDEEERRVTRAVHQLWARSGPPIEVTLGSITADYASLCVDLETFKGVLET